MKAYEATQRNVSRLENHYNRKRKVAATFSLGDKVSVGITKPDRSPTDNWRIHGFITKVKGNKDVKFEIGTWYGILNVLYGAGDLQPYSGTVEVDHKTRISLREAASRNNPNIFTQSRCNCKGSCSNNKCSCKRNNISCSTHCYHLNDKCKKLDWYVLYVLIFK